MSHTYTNLLTHVIFSTKDCEPLITAALHDDLLAYMGGIVREIGGALRAANSRPDHVHPLCSLPPTVAISDAPRVVKTNSSRWVNREGRLASFDWQTGYGAISVSHSLALSVTR
jgi:REP element-mobilizing transposase RayT